MSSPALINVTRIWSSGTPASRRVRTIPAAAQTPANPPPTISTWSIVNSCPIEVTQFES
jgi:hypothetical protein